MTIYCIFPLILLSANEIGLNEGSDETHIKGVGEDTSLSTLHSCLMAIMVGEIRFLRWRVPGPVIAKLVMNKLDQPNVVWSVRPEAHDRGIMVLKAVTTLMAFGKL